MIAKKYYYISFEKLNSDTSIDHFKRNDIIKMYRYWLIKEVGERDVDWCWHVGDIFARGVFIKDKGAAVLFRLKFG